MNKIQKFVARAVVASSVAVAGVASAVPPTTVGELASAVSFADVAIAILAIAGTLITLYVTWKGAKMVLASVKGA